MYKINQYRLFLQLGHRIGQDLGLLVHIFTNTMTYEKGAKPFLTKLLYSSRHFDLSCAEIQEES